ncbi:HAMP domain-containing histidine kinase [Candidatus Saccharibacteria bacterium]|nr:HAMP domain-containing histidine kinase [Candidatus Saccharibacteria bacterium]
MFKKLRTRIIIITMAITTAVLVLAGSFIMLFSSTMRPEPMFRLEVDFSNISNPLSFDDRELKNFIESDRIDGSNRLLIALLSVGATVEVIVFVIVYSLSQKIIEPVKDSYEKQKLFIANASHELKTPLAIIQANMEALDVDKDNEKWKTNIENEVTHANKLVLDLLQLAKMDAGSIDKAASEQIDLNNVITERIEIFQPKFSGKITLSKKTKDLKQTLPKQDFLQVLDILLDNATKYGNKKITITLNQNELSVANDGATVEKKDLEKIFDRFYQTDKTKEGSGLGLAIAKAICEQNNWRISCESNKKTTTFNVEL